MIWKRFEQLAAVKQTQAVIEFDRNGVIRWANENFLRAMGYRLEEIQGRHHRMFVKPEYAASREYAAFWEGLAAGQARDEEFQRFGKGGKEVWIKATYCPLRDVTGRVSGVTKFAVDITATKQLARRALGAAHEIAENSKGLGEVSERLNANASQAAVRAEAALAGSSEVRSSTENVARSAEQMMQAIQEIARSSAESTRMAEQAVHSASAGNQRMQQLNESYEAIGQVVELISAIAQQTNLLALNATIEASRAGEAGRGFAVVADEVKQLAKRTEEATRDIAARIQVAREDTAAATAAIAEVAQVIEQVNGLSSTIAAAVEEQTVMTNEIGNGVRQAAEGTAQIAESIEELARAARETAEGAAQTRQTANTMAGLASEIDQLAL